jgi:hypothetical protein
MYRIMWPFCCHFMKNDATYNTLGLSTAVRLTRKETTSVDTSGEPGSQVLP